MKSDYNKFLSVIMRKWKGNVLKYFSLGQVPTLAVKKLVVILTRNER